MAMPTVHMAAKCVVDGEDSEEIFEADIVTCAARVVLTRHSHLVPGEPSVVGRMPANTDQALKRHRSHPAVGIKPQTHLRTPLKQKTFRASSGYSVSFVNLVVRSSLCESVF